ncbi:MAG: hypothetical protein A3J38_00245 [Gammaproteobacteria bacterium RIFCSPHIGHO2_12_FULL_45_9]|nr:MAG: hypothetical protein A3J38_00245 [Gammaproteobacteria bacterium RIFCSPHIGHO2_12_FULL_45_9]
MIKSVMCRVMEKMISAYWVLHPEGADVLKRHEGKSLLLAITPGGQVVLLVEAGKIKVLGEPLHPVTAEVSGTLSEIVGVLCRGKTTLAGSGLLIRGDGLWASELMRDLSSLELDWEAVLGTYTGPLVAQGVARSWAWLKQETEMIPHAVKDQVQTFLHQESQWLPMRAEVETWVAAVRVLQFDVERLAARLQQLCA